MPLSPSLDLVLLLNSRLSHDLLSFLPYQGEVPRPRADTLDLNGVAGHDGKGSFQRYSDKLDTIV